MVVADGFYDINVSPDKREVFLRDEPAFLEALKSKLVEWFETIQRVKAFDMPIQSLTPPDRKRFAFEAGISLENSKFES